MTKLVTAVAMMQLVEKGLASLDEDVCDTLPELKDIDILLYDQESSSGSDPEGSDQVPGGGKPADHNLGFRTEKAKTEITIK